MARPFMALARSPQTAGFAELTLRYSNDVQVILSSRALLGPVKSFTTVRMALAVVEHPFSTDKRL